MESQKIVEFPSPPKTLEDIIKPKMPCDILQQDGQMTSSMLSMTSSLTSPVDSGVQLLDSESEITSLMSMSGIGCDIDTAANVDNEVPKNGDALKICPVRDDVKDKQAIDDIEQENAVNSIREDIANDVRHSIDNKINTELLEGINGCIRKDMKDVEKLLEDLEGCVRKQEIKPDKKDSLKPKLHIMTKSDIDNHNMPHFDAVTSPAVLSLESVISQIHPTAVTQLNSKMAMKHNTEEFHRKFEIPKNLSDDVFELEPILIGDTKDVKKPENDDLMNVSLTSYELLDYTFHNINSVNDRPATVSDEMHVSMSEEVNESLKINAEKSVEAPPDKQPNTPDDQIVFRRQRRKKSKSDSVPKKRVSFHEDILNSTKVDDVHINHGFITHEQDISMSFLERGFSRRPDIVKGRYSWAAEGDTPYYHHQLDKPERQVKSDIYVHRARFSSSSSSSSASISSSIDEEDTRNSTSDDTTRNSTSTSDDAAAKREPTQKLPKSSCLKKKPNKKYIDTNVVQEETNLKKKRSESNLLDSNIFGSLKNMFSFSTSVPLAERGVPEGQEDVTVYSTSESGGKRSAGGDFAAPKRCSNGGYEVQPVPVKKIGNLNLELTKTNLKLTKSEGFYPNYPSNQPLPTNVILCDSNVYEHKGISYSYEYERFQKTFEQQNRPKSSTVYQMLLNELNFFKRREKRALEKENCEVPTNSSSTPTKDTRSEDSQDERSITGSIKKYASSATIDFSDSDTAWDFNDSTSHTRHLNSPKRKLNKSCYSGSSLRSDNLDERSDLEAQLSSAKSLKSSTSKSSLINRFLRNVTVKKMMDLKLQKKQKSAGRVLSLYVRGARANTEMSRQLDVQIEKEIVEAKIKKMSIDQCGSHSLYRFKNEIFRNFTENLVRAFPIYSAYTTSGEHKPLIVVLSSTTLYITSFKPNNSYYNHFVLPYTELNTILIGPNAQTVHLSNYDNDMQCIITTGSESLTGELIGQLEMAIRKDFNKPKLPAVKQLTMRDMANLRKAICKQTAVTKNEEYFHYSIVNIQDYNYDINETPLGPSKEGPLMFKTTETDSRWETAYFILKAGILYMLSSPSHRLPMRVLPLINGACQGARRVYNCTRPHTFQVQVGAITLHLAAPDEYVASEWLQALVHAASKTYSHREKMPAQSCTLLMTSNHILTVREAFPCTFSSSLSLRELHQPIKGTQAVSCASIADITAFKLPCAEQSWCILEFACREVHESSGDWIVYFATNAELEKFISTLEMLWAYHNEQGDCFPLSTIPETDPLSRKCVDTYNMIQNTWLSLQMNFQSF